MSRNTKIALFILFIAGLVSVGFFREYLFLNINYALEYVKGESMRNRVDSSLTFLTEFQSSTLYKLKWLGTIAFVVLYWGIGMLFLRFYYPARKFYRYYSYIYLAIIACAFISYVSGYLFSASSSGYAFARQIMGVAQSPAPLMFLWGAIQLERKGQ